jgi:hypothetical protein
MKEQEICNVRLIVHAATTNLKRGMINEVGKGQLRRVGVHMLGEFSRIFGREITFIVFETCQLLGRDK